MFAKIISLQGNQVTLQLDDELNMDQLQRFAAGKQPTAELIIQDERLISPDQRKKIFALIHDVSQFTGYDERDTEMVLKYRYYAKTGADSFSMSNCDMTTANRFLTFILDFCFEWDIPFRTKLWDSIPTDYHLAVQCLRYRKCVICGKPAEIAHYTAVGNRKRNHTDHRKFSFMSLCPECHKRQHQQGIKSFIYENHIKPVKLSETDLIRLHIMTRKQIDYWNQRYQMEGRDDYLETN